MAHRLLRDTEADGWERSDFPIICETCLGANPYVRMTKANFDKECKICTRPFTVFRWRPGRDARYKKTEVCQTCSKLKNVCQVCLLDLEYGLPVQVRDTALGIDTTGAIPQSDINREYFAEEQEKKARAGLDYESSFGKARANDTILKLQRTEPYYKRNRAHVCSFFVRGECTRGAECPFRHEMPITGDLAHQNIKDRYYGVNDPVANKLLNRAKDMPSLDPPSDLSIKTLYVGGIDDRVTEEDLKDQFYGYGELDSIKVVPTRNCAFVMYTTREGAEKAASTLAHKLVIKGLRLRLLWGRPPAPKPDPSDAVDGGKGILGNSSLSLLPRTVQSMQSGGEGGGDDDGGGGQSQPVYPSMDPQRMGAVEKREKGGEGRENSGGEHRGQSAPFPGGPVPQPELFHRPPYQNPAYAPPPPPPGAYHHHPSPSPYMHPSPMPYHQPPPPGMGPPQFRGHFRPDFPQDPYTRPPPHHPDFRT